jgi:flagellar basal-body rod protein FlgC
MDWFSGLKTSLTGLQASRSRLDAVTENLVHAESSSPDDAGTYQVQRVRLREVKEDHQAGRGVAWEKTKLSLPPRLDYWPNHPDADANGMVRFPDIDLVQEMTEMMAARKAYEIGVNTFNEGRHMFLKTLDIGRE